MKIWSRTMLLSGVNNTFLGRRRRRQWHPTPVLLPGKSHGWSSLVGCSPWGLEESDTTEWLHFHFSLSCIGEGNGNNTGVGCHFLLQCMKVKSLSCVRLFETPWTAAYQAPLSMWFSRQEYWNKNQRHHFADKGLYSQSDGLVLTNSVFVVTL